MAASEALHSETAELHCNCSCDLRSHVGRGPAVPIGATLIYTLPLCNLIALVQDHLGFIYRRQRALNSWWIYSP